jgi:hypothetical protein
MQMSDVQSGELELAESLSQQDPFWRTYLEPEVT